VGARAGGAGHIRHGVLAGQVDSSRIERFAARVALSHVSRSLLDSVRHDLCHEFSLFDELVCARRASVAGTLRGIENTRWWLVYRSRLLVVCQSIFVDKIRFNAAHPYWMWIPILAFIYFRNITPTFRSYHSAFLNYLGKITLETYLLQFHVFLAARRPGLPWAPTKLIALLPNWPFCNMLLCGLIFIGCARLSFLATLTLRDEILSSASSRQWQSRALITLASFALFALLALVLPFNDDLLLGICCGLIVLSFLLAFALDWRKSNLF